MGWMKSDLLLVLTIGIVFFDLNFNSSESVVLGVVLGFVIRPFNPRQEFGTFCFKRLFSNDVKSLIGFPGEIFLQIVEMVILPLIISSVISGMTFSRIQYFSALAQIKPSHAGRIGSLTVLYYLTTTFLATFVGQWSFSKITIQTGIILVSSIHPGDPLSGVVREKGKGTSWNTQYTLLRKIIKAPCFCDSSMPLVPIDPKPFPSNFSCPKTVVYRVFQPIACKNYLLQRFFQKNLFFQLHKIIKTP